MYQAARRAGLPVRELKADSDKWSRARPAAARLSAGTVYFLSGASWLHDLEDELLSFPNGTHDDQAGLPVLCRSGGGPGPWEAQSHQGDDTVSRPQEARSATLRTF